MSTTPMYLTTRDTSGQIIKIKIAEITMFGGVFDHGKYAGQILPGGLIDKHIEIKNTHFDHNYHFGHLKFLN